MDTLRFFNPYEEIRFTENLLPHWQQRSGTYKERRLPSRRASVEEGSRLRTQWEDERKGWLQSHPEPWNTETEQEYHKRFTGAIERWLDAGYGSCVLRQNNCARIVDHALRYFDGQRLALISSVVMPNHVHALLVQNREHPLEELLHSWKSFTSRSINRLLGRSGTLWQRSYFDRLVRDEQHFRNCVRYIRRNPEKAHLVAGKYILYQSDLAKQIA